MKKKIVPLLIILTMCMSISSNFKLIAYGEDQLNVQQNLANEAIILIDRDGLQRILDEGNMYFTSLVS